MIISMNLHGIISSVLLKFAACLSIFFFKTLYYCAVSLGTRTLTYKVLVNTMRVLVSFFFRVHVHVIKVIGIGMVRQWEKRNYSF